MVINPFDLSKRDRFQQVPLDKILLGIGISYLGWVMLWLSSHPLEHRSVSPAAKASNSEAISPSDRAFSAYLQQSLKTIDRNKLSQAQQNNRFPTATYPHPINPSSNQASLLATRLIPNGNIVQGIAPMPPISGQNPLKSEPVTRILLSAPKIRAPKILPAPTSPTTVPVLSTSAHPLPSTSEQLSAPAQTLVHHNLVGLLESGDQSTVLVTFNGITRRFAIGETLGSSGWQLVSVSNQRAIISRHGVTRSLDVGQGF